jgi:sec-independent protein translocase protein TatC
MTKIDTSTHLTDASAMPVGAHIEELRKRILVALLALVVTTMVSFAFAEKGIEYLAIPVGGVENLISLEVTENVGVYMRVALLSGFILALPVMLYQILAFVLPGLKPAEKRSLLLAIPAAVLLFASGVLFAYFVMLPAALPFLISFITVKTTLRLSSYFEFVTSLLFWIGLSFEMPLVVYVLARFGLVKASHLLRGWRFALVIIAILAAVITPTPDPVNMGLLMVPLFLLYLLSILFAHLARPSKNP